MWLSKDLSVQDEELNTRAAAFRTVLGMAGWPLQESGEVISEQEALARARARLLQIEVYLRPIVLAENQRQFGWERAYRKPA